MSRAAVAIGATTAALGVGAWGYNELNKAAEIDPSSIDRISQITLDNNAVLGLGIGAILVVLLIGAAASRPSASGSHHSL